MGEYMLLPLSAAALGITGLASIPAVFAILSQIRNRTPKDNFYEDKDGKSTPEAIAAFSNKVPKTVIVLLSILGFASTAVVSVLTTLDSARHDLFLESWLMTASWAAILLQATVLAAHHSPVQTHDLGLWAFLSSLVTAVAASFQLLSISRHAHVREDVALVLRIVNVCIIATLLFACLSIPRRPHVFHKDRQVDSEWTVSAINRYTWTWAGALLTLARNKGDLDEKDIPSPGHDLRAEDLVSEWSRANYQGGLLRSLLRTYGHRLVVQWSITAARCVLGIGPFWTMLRLVQKLEKKDTDDSPKQEFPSSLCSATRGPAGADTNMQWIDGWVVWYSVTGLGMPIRAQLSALVFEKSLRRKNVKSADNTKEDDKPSDDAKKDDAEDNGNDDENSNDEASVLKSRQAIVNLVGVDAKHIADFAMMQFFLVSSLGKLIIFSGFLVQLIGWLPFGSGILAWALVLPINAWVSKLYMKAEDTLMKNRDSKLAVVNEALVGMRQIKFSALESEWEKRILEKREVELRTIRWVFTYDTVLFFCWIASPILLAAASLSIYAAVHGALSPSVAFVSVGIFKSLEDSLSILPDLLASGMDTLVSIKRIETYLNGPEMDKTLSEGHDVAFDNARIAWPVDGEVPDEHRFILSNINLSFPEGELSVISGKTGTGKSLLLSALLGEADLLGGSIFMPPTAPSLERNDDKAHPGNWILPGAVAYVGQSPWLESASLRDNILFGLPFLEDRYDKVLEVCTLKKDLDILTDGDKTELGANGVNLSGGQKWRVTLARAIYSRAEILILDDIFSAVDAHVGRQIFEKCIAGDICNKRTRILVTHHVALVQSKTKYLVELGEGTVMHYGLTSDLAEDGTLQKIKSHEQTEAEIQADENADGATAVNSEEASVLEPADGEDDATTLHKVASKGKQFVEDETHEKGMVKRRVYATYMKSSGGWFFWIICIMFYVAFEVANIGRNWWLRIWTGDPQEQASVASTAHEHGLAYGLTLQHSMMHAASHAQVADNGHKSLSFYLTVYIVLATASGIIGAVRFLWSFVMSIKASRALFEKILFTVLRTKLRWLDTVPVGRILNRLTADFDIIDNRITTDMGFMFWRLLGLLGVCAAAMLVSAYILPLAVVIVFVSGIVGKVYLDGARPVKRIESSAKSPVFEIFNAALAGVSTLRAFQKTQVYTDRMYGFLDSWDGLSQYTWTLNRWLGFRMALIGTVFTTVVGVIVVGSSFVDAAMAGFTLSFALDFSRNMLMLIRGYASLELNMNAAERVIEYTDLETEDLGGEEPPAAWPTSGNMEVKDLVAAYADDLPPVLKGVSFKVSDNERIGVIGRTGAGKSSLTLALFRFLEARSGAVYIDGLDISKVNLHCLRSRLAIIPQDPILFSGTVRSNLDPFNDHTDEELRDCLSRVHLVDSEPATPANEPIAADNSSTGPTLAPKNINIFRDLSSGISESGGNLSQGQRQLLCIARAIISRPKIMVLDEATSAVDISTDALIQRSIREEFSDSTLLVIAHRLSTIADFDRILVLSEGRVAEYGTPRELWGKEGGIFRDMCEHSGEKDKLREVVLGR
ncbi:ATP-dependent bile acid permease [Tolypocladium capitatum]|uniref:ATP-dependent bile acid permease n=1 Tax=Tolypocladium capitatum TaxID=45235 RepID=A0A2K3QFW5_9HYPO|nr:ATP-dependent bile acid permease [Tolypocladium capitatum]